jgi:hypothetical protein
LTAGEEEINFVGHVILKWHQLDVLTIHGKFRINGIDGRCADKTQYPFVIDPGSDRCFAALIFCRREIFRAKRDLGKSRLCRRRCAAIIDVDLEAVEGDLFGVDPPVAVVLFRRLCGRGSRRLRLCNAGEIDGAVFIALDIAAAVFPFDRADDNGFFSDIDGNVLQRQRRDAL